MAKISNTNTYPTKASPSSTDYVIGTDASSKETKTFTLQSIANLYGGSGSGTVTSVGLDGGTTGLTITSDTTNPITTIGTFTLGGTLAVANGGTGLSALGTRSQVMSVNAGATGLEFTDPKVIETIEANEAISKGDPLYIVSWNNGTSTAVVAKADASNPAKMPCVGLAQENLTTGATGEMMVVGLMDQINVNAIPSSGPNPLVNDVIYVASGGGLTSIKPTGTNLIQNIAIVVNASAQGTLQITAIGRTNDLPNLPEGSIWLGDSNGVPSALGIGTNNTVLISNGTTASWQPSTGTAIDVGFTPLSIYASTDKVLDSSTTGTTLFIQSVCDMDITINAVDFFLNQISGSPQLTIGLYSGTIVGSSSSTLLGTATTSVLTTLGVNTLNFSTPITLTAGQNIVIYISSNNGTRYIGSSTGFTDVNLALSLVGNNTDPNNSLATAIETSTATTERIALHFYST